MTFYLRFGPKAESEFEKVERGVLLREFPNPHDTRSNAPRSGKSGTPPAQNEVRLLARDAVQCRANLNFEK